MPRMTTLLTLIVGTAIAFAPGLSVHAAEVRPNAALDDELPIKRVTLYRSGVGSFERSGTVDGDETVSLRFETDQINDILKTMVLLDLDGGKIGAVSYASKDPLARRLAGFEVDISRAPTIDQLFIQLRGSPVSLQTGDGVIEGTILGVEPRKTVIPASSGGGNPGHFDEPYVSLVTAKGVRAIAVSRITSFEFADKKLAEELNRALGALAGQRADRLKSVDLNFNGPAGKARRVTVAYVHETPVWKASYRLVLPDDGAKKGGKDEKPAKPLLQGWAIVENTTDTDWRDVTLSLASGRPVSFVMPLYDPIYGQRPVVPVPVLGGIMPRNFEDEVRGMRTAAKAAAPAAPAASMLSNSVADEADRKNVFMGKAVGGAEGNSPVGEKSYAMVAMQDAMAGQSQASGADAGEQFLYTIDQPVTIERQNSAMLPILGAPIDGKRVSIYNPNDGLKNPMRGVQLNNDTGLHLMPGPIAVYDAGTYAGDAQIPHTARNAKRLLAYALDLDVAARNESKTERNVTRVSIKDGLVVQRVTQHFERVYSFDNHDPQRGRTILVEHPRTIGWELIEPKQAAETTESLYRFEVPAPADKPAEFKVVEEQVVGESFGVTSYALETILMYAKDGKASPAVVEAVKKAAALQAEVNTTRKSLAELEAARTEIGADQGRIRENMGRIDRNSELYGRYMKKLSDQESELEKNLADKDRLLELVRKQEKALADFLNGLAVE